MYYVFRYCMFGRHAAVMKQVQQGSVPQSKLEQAQEDMEEAMTKMEQTRVS